MNKDFSQAPRPTFKNALRRISMISVVISMTLVWLLLSAASVITLKQYAQKNLELTAATMGRSLEAALVFGDATAAEDTLATLGRQGQFSEATLLDSHQRHFADWRNDALVKNEKFSGYISKWLFPEPTVQPIWHQGKIIGELRLKALDRLISHFLGTSLIVLTGSILLASVIALMLTHSLHRGIVAALQSITEVVHDIRENRHFSRRVPEERIEEFHLFAQDFNSLLGEMEDWQRQLQAKNAQLLRSSLHDPLTGLANRAAFRNVIGKLMDDDAARHSSALLFLDGDNFKLINDNWGHAAGDKVLIEVASRLMAFVGDQHQAWRLGGDEFAILLHDVHTETEVQALCATLSEQFLQPFNLHNGHTATLSLSIGYALTWEHTSVEELQELADQNMYRMKNQRFHHTQKKEGMTMLRQFIAPTLLAAFLLTGCQAPGKFSKEQVAAMKSYGFTEAAGDWSLGLSDSILFDKNDYRLRPDSQQQIHSMAARLAETGITHGRLEGHTDNYGEDSYNEALSLKRANSVADAWAEGAKIPRSNLTTRGLGKKYPIASNNTAAGRAENRRVTVVISTP